jgi:hypothetical protein
VSEYKETEAPEGDTRGEVLDQLCQYNPWVLVITEINADDTFSIKVECGGGVSDVKTIKALLARAHRELP